ncbi:MAG: helix-turn-helix transcriptional regulator, partial [Oscillospiraceae bacterium]|nr:helix-turn-helix transcriptional regulator [Oscillospiraceae bacterium]
QTEHIFAAFYGQPEELTLPYQRVKALELLLYLARMEFAPQNGLTEYPKEQVELVREIHSQLLRHMERRITIEELSRQYLINPTTLKAVFKAVYGTSLAAHIKEHRMEQAAKLLLETNMSVSDVAQAVGYDSQSKFAAAFKDALHVLPREYRKRFMTGG